MKNQRQEHGKDKQDRLQWALEGTGNDRYKLNFEKLQYLIEYFKPSLDSVRGKDIIIVLGLARIGKSTFLNYQFGTDFKYAVNERRDPIVVPSGGKKPLAAMSDAVKTCTIFPTVYERDGQLIVDFPGLEGNRVLHVKVFESIAIEMMINVARSVKATIAISSHAFADRAQGLRDNVKLFGNLFTDIEDIKKKLLFFITKPDPELTNVDEKIGFYYSANAIYNRLQGKNLTKDQQSKLDFLSLIIKQSLSEDQDVDPERIDEYLVNSLSVNVTRKDIEPQSEQDSVDARTYVKNKLAELPTVTRDDFNFRQYDQYRTEFDELIVHQISFYVNLIASIEKDINDRKKVISRKRKAISDLEDTLKRLKRDAKACEKENRNHLVELEDEREEKYDIATNSSDVLQQWLDRLDKLNKRLRRVNSNKKVYYKTVDFSEKRWKALGWWVNLPGRSKFTFTYRDYIPYLKIKPIYDKSTGSVEIIEKDRRNNIYEAKYKSHYRKSGECSFEIYVKSKHHPDNVDTINHLLNKINDAEKKKSKVEKRHNKDKDRLKKIDKKISELTSRSDDEQKDFNRKIKSTKRKIREAKEELQTLKSAHEAELAPNGNIRKRIMRAHKKYRFHYDYLNMIEIDSNEVNKFKQLYSDVENRKSLNTIFVNQHRFFNQRKRGACDSLLSWIPGVSYIKSLSK